MLEQERWCFFSHFVSYVRLVGRIFSERKITRFFRGFHVRNMQVHIRLSGDLANKNLGLEIATGEVIVSSRLG